MTFPTVQCAGLALIAIDIDLSHLRTTVILATAEITCINWFLTVAMQCLALQWRSFRPICLHFCFTMVLNLQSQSSIQCRFFATIIGERLTLLNSQNFWRLSLGSVHIWKLKMCLWLQLNGRYHHLITKPLIKAQWLLPSFNYLKHVIRFKQIYICL